MMAARQATLIKRRKTSKGSFLPGQFCFRFDSADPPVQQRARYSEARRKEVGAIRKARACLRCHLQKKSVRLPSDHDIGIWNLQLHTSSARKGILVIAVSNVLTRIMRRAASLGWNASGHRSKTSTNLVMVCVNTFFCTVMSTLIDPLRERALSLV